MQRNTAVQRNRRASSSLVLSPGPRGAFGRTRLNPMMRAVAALLTAGAAIGAAGPAQAQRALGAAWMAQKNLVQETAAATGRLPNGQLASTLTNPLAQQQQAQAQLARSIGNLNLAARGIAQQQAAQAAARAAALAGASSVPDGLGEGGLQVDTNSLTAGWANAQAPVQSRSGGQTQVTVAQTGAQAVLNWETFNIGRDTTLKFEQQPSWAVLNRVNDPQARPSQIQGRIQAEGTVMVVNRNGIVFSGASQVDTRNLLASAVGMSDSQFKKGLFSEAQGTKFIPSLANDLATTASSFSHGAATGDVVVEAGARIQTHQPVSVTEGGGYVMLLGREARNAGQIVTASGQTVLAAGDAFVIRRGMGTEANQSATTRGNMVGTLRQDGSAAGLALNTGLVQAATGDITLTGHTVRQQGVAVATTSVNARGTVHLNNAEGDTEGRVLLEPGSVSAVLLSDAVGTALDAQRDALLKDSDKAGDGVQHRRDQSLVLIDSAGAVDFRADSLTLATGGQVMVKAARTEVAGGAAIDVSGAVGVRVAMEANNVLVNAQGNEQRDAPVNRDGKRLNNKNIWVDRRDLVFVPAGTQGYETDRWYTAGGLLEVGGYLGITGHGVGEWMAQGGTVQFSGNSLATQAGSLINLAGGSLDVQTGYVKQTFLKGADGRLYNASRAPGDLLYTGVYQGFESAHSRWGVSEHYASPLIAPERRLESGYTVGRDAGRLIVATQAAALEGAIDGATFQGARQTRARDTVLDGYQQAQTAVARGAQLVVGTHAPVYDSGTKNLAYVPGAVAAAVTLGGAPGAGIHLAADWLQAQHLGVLRVHATGSIVVGDALSVAPGGEIVLHAHDVQVNADLGARGGSIVLGNVVKKLAGSSGWLDSAIAAAPAAAGPARTVVAEGVRLDTRGLWSNLALDPNDVHALPYLNGGSIRIHSSGEVVVAQGALLDASAGAVLRANGSQTGGRGGDIALLADGLAASGGSGAVPGRLVLGGELRSLGAKGGGTLRLQSGGAVVIGGQVPGNDGRLPAGQASPVDLIAQDAFTIAAGAVLPADYRYTRTRALPGEVIGAQPLIGPASAVTLHADWALPKVLGSSDSYTVQTQSGAAFTVFGWTSSPPTVPAGTVITGITTALGGFPLTYGVPADVFPQGLPIQPTAAVIKAGAVAAVEAGFAAGTRIVAGFSLAQDLAVVRPLSLDAGLFRSGFSRYEITGHQSLAVAASADLRVEMPVLRLDPEAARTRATGADPAGLLSAWLPEEFTADPARRQLQQRQGADLQLNAGYGVGSLATLTVAQGARIEVDAGRAIGLRSNGQVMVDGTLRSAGGRIDFGNFGYGPSGASSVGHDRSIWIGAHAVLDVSGAAHVAVDAKGRRYGTVQGGGSIQIGGSYNADATFADGVDAFIVVRPGALLDASGTQAVLDLPDLGRTDLASNGGLIHLNSFNGLFVDGTLRAPAGGAGAAGGTLALVLEAPNYAEASHPDARVRSLREFTLGQQQGDSVLPAGLLPGRASATLAYGHGRLGVDRVQAGGFDNLSLLVNGVLSFDSPVNLAMDQSLRLTAHSFSLAEGSSSGARVSLAAPYVRLAGASRVQRDKHIIPGSATSGRPVPIADSRLLVDAGLLDVFEAAVFGSSINLAQITGNVSVQRAGFDTVELRSAGDLRMLRPLVRDRTVVDTAGDLLLVASQIYPATGALGEFRAQEVGRGLRIERTGDALPPAPYSAFGSLVFLSSRIEQGGVLRAPLGSIVLGKIDVGDNPATHSVLLRDGSLTSVSGAGLRMPYGGTKDGLTYVYDGKDVVYRGLGGGSVVNLIGDRVDVQQGAVIDLSGGGELLGAAFLSGRGGSTDARLNPLVQVKPSGAFVLPGLATNPVYAIVPGAQPGAAPLAAEKGAGDPVVGRQITLGAGVPGLPAGTYTLMPSSYALLPGAFRVELNGLAASAMPPGATAAMRNGSFSTAGQLSIAGTPLRDVLATQVILTPADTVRSYSQYNETGYARFGLDWAARDGAPRPLLERDAKRLRIDMGTRPAEGKGLEIAAGTVRNQPAAGGFGSELVLGALGSGGAIEILAPGQAPTAGFAGVSVRADMLNAVGASTLAIGGAPGSTFESERNTQNARNVSFGTPYSVSGSIVLRAGARLEAAQVFLATGQKAGGIVLEQGAGIHTLGHGAASWDSTHGYIFDPGQVSLLAVSNGWLDVLAPTESTDTRFGSGRIQIGQCAGSANCRGDTTLYSSGTITAATTNSFELGDSVRYGARNLVLAVGGINVGSAEALARARNDGALTPGLTLNQQVLDRLIRGDTSTGAPALENLVLAASSAVSFYESVKLSTLDANGKSSLAQLVLTAPAVYGHGQAGDVARIETDSFVWNGSALPPGGVVTGGPGTGSGQLVIDARQIEFGYGAQTQPKTVLSHDRLALGFAAVELNASERITANHRGSLAVYQSQGAWDDAAKAFGYSGGDLRLRAPLITGHAGSVNAIRAGGSLSATAPAGRAAAAPDNAALASALGAELSLDAGAGLLIDTAVLLPSGKLTLSAQGNVQLADGARLDLAGRRIDFFDLPKYSWGGEVRLESRGGDVLQAAGSRIDLSAQYNRAGRLGAVALEGAQGTVDLRGTLLGHASGHYDAGGTPVPHAAGFVDIRAQHIADFAGLNARLGDGGVVGGRSFQLRQGDLAIGDELKGREINVSVDHGSLRVHGRIDASGEQAGSIRLAAKQGVTLDGTAVLDASASVLRRDSYGQAIDAPNRAVIEIDAGEGLLRIAGGARLDLRVAGATQKHGTVALNAPRVGANDVAIDAAGPVAIEGAKAIHVNAFVTDHGAAPGTEATVDGKSYQVIDQAYLDRLHAASDRFIDAALANGALMDGRLAGLRAHADAFHLRPGLRIVADAAVNPDGNLHLDGDIDLSGHRYASVNPHTPRSARHGSGEAGALVIRAQGNLEVYGSLSDGFDGSRLSLGATPDDKGWFLPAGVTAFGGDVVIPHAGFVTLDTGTEFALGRTLNYAAPVQAATLPVGTVLPTAIALAQVLNLPAGMVLGAAVRDAAGTVLHAAGSVVPQGGLTLPVGTRLDAGLRLPGPARMQAGLWPAGVPLPVAMTLARPLALDKGAIVPSETVVKLPGGVDKVSLRPALDADGNQGRTWALAPMLAAGSQSWDLRLVAGADLQAADTRLTQPHSTARLQLADAHFGMGQRIVDVPGTGSPATYLWGDLSLFEQMIIEFWGEYVLSFMPVSGTPITAAQIQELRDNYILSASPGELNDFGYGDLAAVDTPATPPDRASSFYPAREQLFSVLRTGTGDLDLVSGGDLQTRSPYGVYTADAPAASMGAAYDQPRGLASDGTPLWQAEGKLFEHLVDGGARSLYGAWYPTGGGNLLVRAGRDIAGDLMGRLGGLRTWLPMGAVRDQIGSSTVGNWLWRQGTGSVEAGKDQVPVAWWINFGTYVQGSEDGSYLPSYAATRFENDPYLVGFTGFGTLGGGNLVVEAGGQAGIVGPRGEAPPNYGTQSERRNAMPRSEGLNLAVASTGRMNASGELVLTGGGDLDLRIGGGLNPNAELRRNEHDLNSTFANLRGALRVQAGAIGGLDLRYGARDQMDSRGGDPFSAGRAYGGGGPVLVLGDAVARLDTRGDLVLGGVADPGRTKLLNATPFTYDGRYHAGGGWSWFSLWTPATAIDLFSAGGNLTPTTAWAEGQAREETQQAVQGANQSPSRDGQHYPSILRAVSASGSLYYGVGTTSLRYGAVVRAERMGLTLAPAPIGAQYANATGTGELQLLARDAIYAGGYAVTASTADPAGLSSPFRPGFMGVVAATGGGDQGQGPVVVHNVHPDLLANQGATVSGNGRQNTASLFTFGSQATSAYAAVGQAPAHYYAVEGDIVGLRMGQIAEMGYLGAGGTRYEGSMPVAIRAGRDITDSGTRLGYKDTVGVGRGNLISHGRADDISVVEAGRDVRHSTFYVTGPGLIEVSAGRDLYFADRGEIKTLGAVVNAIPGDRASGASVVLAAGMGEGARWDAFAARYLDPANLADPGRPLADQPGKALTVYGGALTMAQWLAREFGYSGDEAGAPAFLQRQQALLDDTRRAALAEGRTAANRSLAREYRVESRQHLVNWLSERFGSGDNRLGLRFDASLMDARAFFDALPPAQQRAFLRNVYYAELKAAGREYNEEGGPRAGSYLRGREAIATLLPAQDAQDAQGRALAYGGDLTLFSSAIYFDADYVDTNGVGKDRPTPGRSYITKAEWTALGSPGYGVSFYDVLDAGIHTNFGGDISIMTPGGRTLVGVDGGFVPGPGAGVMTQGEGDIQVYAHGSVLMGQSRVFTTFGGNILAWSAEGDINAGRGAKTTVVYTPQRRVYDSFGNVSLSPSTPNSGAGIATLNPIPEIPPGDIDLIAPLGTIDAGEAGIRVSGNVNLAALHVVNAENIQVQGKAVGIPVVAAVNVGALTNASAAASQASVAAQDMLQRERAAARQALPSVFTVRVLGFGNEAPAAPPPGREGGANGRAAYDPGGVVQVLGAGVLSAAQQQPLTPGERRGLAR